MKKKTHFLWITDPWHTLDHERDSSLRLAREAIALGHLSSWCNVRSIRLENDQVLLDALTLDEAGALKPGLPKAFDPMKFNSLQYRTDPPVNLAYLHPLQLLTLGLQGAKQSQIVNPPEVLFSANEKFEAALLGDFMPAGLVSSQWEKLLDFGKREGRTVLKPLHEAQSHGIELLDWRKADGIEHAKQTLAGATERFTRPVILQRYLEGICDGEQRLWFLDGKLLAFARKLPLQGDFRVNLDRGSQVVTTRLSASEKRAAQAISKRLQARKIRLAAVDLIEGKVTDFNFTSPGLILQMEKVSGENLARPIVQALARLR